jgi:hypothetical protein
VHALVRPPQRSSANPPAASRRFFQAVLTPGITRRPEPFAEHDKMRVGGRVHAVVRFRRRRHHSLAIRPMVYSGRVETKAPAATSS